MELLCGRREQPIDSRSPVQNRIRLSANSRTGKRRSFQNSTSERQNPVQEHQSDNRDQDSGRRTPSLRYSCAIFRSQTARNPKTRKCPGIQDGGQGDRAADQNGDNANKGVGCDNESKAD